MVFLTSDDYLLRFSCPKSFSTKNMATKAVVKSENQTYTDKVKERMRHITFLPLTRKLT